MAADQQHSDSSKVLPLFRLAEGCESVERIRRYKDVRLPVDLRVYVILLIGLILAGGLSIAQFSYAEKIAVAGRLSDGTAELFAITGGVIKTLHVGVGDRVVVGDVLATLEAGRDRGVDDAGYEQLRALSSQERRELGALISSEILGYRQSLAALRREEQDLTHRRSIFLRQRRFLKQELHRQTDSATRLQGLFERRLIRIGERDAVLTERNRTQARLLDNELQITDTDAADSRLQERLASADLQHRERLSELGLELLQIDRRIYDLRSVGAQALRAKFDGVVSQVLVDINQTIDRTTPIVSVRPRHGRLSAELFLSSQAMGVATIGSPVRLRYDAYPYRQYGLFDAVIVELDEAAVQTRGGADATYRARAQLLPIAAPASITLRDDMTFVADLEGERRRIVHVIFEPLQGLWRRLSS